MGLLAGLEGRGHCLVVDNYFSSISLFRDLVGKGIYTTGISTSYVLYCRDVVAIYELLKCLCTAHLWWFSIVSDM